MKTHPSRRACKAPLRPVAAAAVTSLLALSATAQQAPAPAAAADASTEQITITGSRIRGIAPIGSPVVGVSRDAIESSGVVSVAQALQQVPQIFNLGVSENSRGQAGGAGNITYGSSINLRGIGPFATLVLVNGHRVVGQGTTAAAVDPNIIPMLLLERVEIVPDGASAIYGSDAVAGVANLIMRREKGAQGYVRFGQGDNYNERQAGALWGTRWAGGVATVAFEHSYRSSLSGRHRDFFTGDLRSQGGGDFRPSQCAPGNITISGVTYPIPATGVTPATASSLVAGAANRCDNLKIQDLVPQQERNGLAFIASHDMGPVTVYADGFATQRKFRYQPGALASNLTVPSSNPFYVRPPGAPAGTSQTVAYSFINDLPVNTATGTSESYQGTVGADYSFASGWKAGALYTYGKNDDLSVTTGGLNNAAITAALARTDPATALNVFGKGGNNTAAALANINNVVGYSPGETDFQNLLVKADGPLFSLPGGMVRAAVGYERQDLKLLGGQTTGAITAPSFGEVQLKRTVDSVYAELAVPVFGAANAMAAAQRLDVTLAVRHDRYSDVGDTTNPKFGLSWVPLKGLSLRASYGESFRAPGLTQIRGFTNGGRGGLFVQNYSDPTLNGALRVGVTLSAANPDLKPETAKTKSFGIDFEPARGTKLSLNFFDIQYDNQIVGVLSDLTILNREAAFAGTNIIQRNPSAALQAQLLAQYPINNVPPANWSLFVNGSQFNLGRSISQGFDFQAQTRIPTEEWGQFGLGLSGTVFTKYEVAQTPNSPLVDQLNTIYNPMKFKARASASWNIGAVTASVFVNHINAYDNNLSNPTQKVRGNTTIDARVALALEDLGNLTLFKGTTLALGVTNAFDKQPPFVNIAQSTNGGGGFDPTLVNPVGRVFSISLDKRF
jgi:iron complex outermembrane receptor protein